MFTGIVEEVGTIKQISPGRLQIQAEIVLADTKCGDSIAVNGTCLTVTALGSNWFTADVMPETLRCTSLGQLKSGSPVNLERALTLNSRLGGHIVSGHVDGMGKIISLHDEGNAVLMEVSAAEDVMRYVVKKGSVALDGISLTVADIKTESFVVSLIPHTREVTALREKKAGDTLNIETDIIGRYTEKLLKLNEEKAEPSKLTREFLTKYGF